VNLPLTYLFIKETFYALGVIAIKTVSRRLVLLREIVFKDLYIYIWAVFYNYDEKAKHVSY